MHDAFGEIDSFLRDDELPSSRLHLLEILDHPPNKRKLYMELTITVDAGEPFVKATYRLEGDGPLVFKAYEKISMLRAAISNLMFLLLQTSWLEVYPLSRISLLYYAKACIKPAYNYFNKKFGDDLKIAVSAFKCARFFEPSKVVEIKPTASNIDDLRIFPFFDADSIIDGLKGELPNYLATAEDISAEFDVMEWWKRHEHELPHWSRACKTLVLVQPSSAAAERVFSLLANSFNERQTHSLEDYIEASVMLQYNS